MLTILQLYEHLIAGSKFFIRFCTCSSKTLLEPWGGVKSLSGKSDDIQLVMAMNILGRKKFKLAGQDSFHQVIGMGRKG